MPKGQYNRYVTCEKCDTEYAVKHRACPQCGFERVILTPAQRQREARRKAGSGVPQYQQRIVACEICGEEVGQAGLGSHRSRMHGVVSPNQKYYQPRGGNGKGEWTISLANGKKQIAADHVSDAVAKRIIGMLF